MGDEIDRPDGSRDIPGTSSSPGKTVDTNAPELYEFGPFCLDPKERKLMRGSELVLLAPKAFDTLHLLIRNSGHLVERDELIRQLWPDSFVEDGIFPTVSSSCERRLAKIRSTLKRSPSEVIGSLVTCAGYRMLRGHH